MPGLNRMLRVAYHRYNLGHCKWKMKTTPSPNFSDEKMAGFNLRTDSSLNFFFFWGGGTNFSF